MGHLKYKIIIAGPPAVGKTSLLHRFVQNKFADNYKLTIGTEFLTKTIEFKKRTVKLALWDIGGQRRFAKIRRTFYAGAQGILLVFDLTREDTFKEMLDWLTEIKETIETEVPFVLIGNKLDLIKETGRVFNYNESKIFAAQRNSIYIETSAKTGNNVEFAFKRLSQIIAELTGISIKIVE
jgi:small GTP-binding protein